MPLICGTHHTGYFGKMRPCNGVRIKALPIEQFYCFLNFGLYEIENNPHLVPRQKDHTLSLYALGGWSQVANSAFAALADSRLRVRAFCDRRVSTRVQCHCLVDPSPKRAK